MKWMSLSVLAIVLAVWLMPALGQNSRTPGLRVGVYDSRAVCVASRGSDAFLQPVEDLRKQLAAAEAAGDDRLAEQIRQRGQTLQTLRHMQGFSSAPVDDLLKAVSRSFPQIAADAGVDLIVARVDFASANVEVVDVTDRIVAAFNPDAATLKVIEELRKREPIALTDALEIRD